MSTFNREDFPSVLEPSMAQQAVPLYIPIVFWGMAGAAQGRIEAPYAEIPTYCMTFTSLLGFVAQIG